MRFDWIMVAFLLRLTCAFVASRLMYQALHVHEYGMAFLASAVATWFCFRTIQAWHALKRTSQS